MFSLTPEARMAEDRPKDLITYTEARKLLGMSTGTLTKLLKNGTLRHWPDPLDARVKLVSRADVEGLLANSRRRAA
jgi:excisionase family DNA binding protein